MRTRRPGQFAARGLAAAYQRGRQQVRKIISALPKRNITSVDSGLTLVENEAGSASASPRATAQTADTNKAPARLTPATLHAGQNLKSANLADLPQTISIGKILTTDKHG